MDEDTFWLSTKQDGECLVWTRGKGNGYGYCLFDGRYGTAHRASFRIQMGRWPNGVLHHLCGNRACVRLAHLQEVTAKEHAYIHFGSRTYCPRGHPYEGNNLITANGHRECRQCGRDRGREYMRKKRAREREERGPVMPKTHCKHGHEFNEKNTRWYLGTNRAPRRFCRACDRAAVRRNTLSCPRVAQKVGRPDLIRAAPPLLTEGFLIALRAAQAAPKNNKEAQMNKFQRRRFWALIAIALIVCIVVGWAAIVDAIIVGAITALLGKAE